MTARAPEGGAAELSESARRALAYIIDHPDASPALIGQAMLDGRETRMHRSAQGYGRIGGTMVARLAKAGLVYCSGGGWPRYTATAAGRSRLAAPGAGA